MLLPFREWIPWFFKTISNDIVQIPEPAYNGFAIDSITPKTTTMKQCVKFIVQLVQRVKLNWTLFVFCVCFFSSHSNYSHSMVAGGLLVMSKTTRLTPGTSLTILLEMRSKTS